MAYSIQKPVSPDVLVPSNVLGLPHPVKSRMIARKRTNAAAVLREILLLTDRRAVFSISIPPSFFPYVPKRLHPAHTLPKPDRLLRRKLLLS
jgi:hypothetical protein